MIWLSTHTAHRIPMTRDDFCRAFAVTGKDLLLIESEPGFQKALVSELGAWIKRVPEVRNAVLVNALDASHKDQAVWMKRYEAMLGRDFLWPDEG